MTTIETRRRAPGTLPPGQRALDWFPRFGIDLTGPPPAVPDQPVIAITGAVCAPIEIPLTALDELPRITRRSDFHCVSGWTAVDLDWSGWSFADVYAAFIEPAVDPAATVTHLELVGADDVRFAITIADALADDVLLADRLDGEPLHGAHGAPIRIVSPSQYGYVNIKHLCRIEICTSEPKRQRSFLDTLLHGHSRARVWEEERHGTLPGWLIRPPYRLVKAIMLRTAARATH